MHLEHAHTVGQQLMPYVVAKIFTSGNSQAIRLPKAFRFDANTREVRLRKNTVTGEIIFTPVSAHTAREERLRQIFTALDSSPAPQDFLVNRRSDVARNPFA